MVVSKYIEIYDYKKTYRCIIDVYFGTAIYQNILISREVNKGPFIKYVRSEGKRGLDQKRIKAYMGEGDPTKSVHTKLQFCYHKKITKNMKITTNTPFREYTVYTYRLFLSLSLVHNGPEMFFSNIISMTFNTTQRTLVQGVGGVKRTGAYR